MNYEHPDGAAARSMEARRQAYMGVRAVLSDDHNHELGLFVLKDVIDQVAKQQGSEGLAALAYELVLKLAEAIERVASDEGLAAADLVEVWAVMDVLEVRSPTD